jgi:hypothetical protein
MSEHIGDPKMRIVQVGVFALGVVSFLSAAFFIGDQMGDTLYRVGVAAMLIDLVCMKLQPYAKMG